MRKNRDYDILLIYVGISIAIILNIYTFFHCNLYFSHPRIIDHKNLSDADSFVQFSYTACTAKISEETFISRHNRYLMRHDYYDSSERDRNWKSKANERPILLSGS